MDNLLKPCDLEEAPKTPPEDPLEHLSSDDKFRLKPGESFDKLPCQDRYRLRAEDEISLNSIISALLSRIKPSEQEFRECIWDVRATDVLNEKQSMLFAEKLFISKLEDGKKLCEENKIFLEHELQEIGEFSLKIEESYDGYVVFSKSKMAKGKGNQKCGHSLKGKYDDRFVLICEKRLEFDYIDSCRIEKSLDARIVGNNLIAVRETKINEESQKFKATVNIKGRDKILVLDGGVMLIMRYLIINNFSGNFEYYSMNLFGKIVRGVIAVSPEFRSVSIFNNTYSELVCVTNTQYFNNVPQETSETYYNAKGKMILHFWRDYNYLLHAPKKPQKKEENILPKLELMWKTDNLLLDKYKLDKNLNYENASGYLHGHPEMADFLHDYIMCLLKYKPTNVLEFTVKFFHNLKNTY